MTEPNQRTRPLRVLVLCDWREDIARTVRDHIEAICNLPHHQVRRVSMLGDLPPSLELDRFDAVLLHYSLTASDPRYLSPESRRRIATFGGLKGSFIQDEHRHVDATVAALRDMGIHLLFTCVPQEEVEKVYPEAALPSMDKVTVLTGYVPEDLLSLDVPLLSGRPLDVGYRARPLNAWLGELAQEKSRIAEHFLADVEGSGLRCDISCREEDRIYGQDWIRFLSRCRAVLGTESGASVFDFDGSVQRCVERYQRENPGANFDAISAHCFAELESRIRLNQISPRCFEATAMRTLMVLYEGDYSGVLVPWRHYLPLRKDHSNLREVLYTLRNDAAAQSIVDRAYAEVACDPRWSWRGFAALVDRALTERLEPEMRSTRECYDDAGFHDAARHSVRSRLRRQRRDLIDRTYRMVFGTLLRPLPAVARERVHMGLRSAWQAVRK